MGVVTLKIWHGGIFKTVNNGQLVYEGGKGKTCQIDSDVLCWWDLLDLAKKCGNYSTIEGLCYLIPGQPLGNGLRKVYDDAQVLEMTELALKMRCIEVYVNHGVALPEMHKKVEKLQPRRAPHPPQLDSVRCSPRNCVSSAASSQQKSTEKAKKTLSTHKDASLPLTGPTETQDPMFNHESVLEKSNNTVQEKPIQPLHSSTIPDPKPNQKKTRTKLSKTQPFSSPIESEENFLNDYEWEDPRPNSPVDLNANYYNSDTEDDDADPIYDPYIDKGKAVTVDKGGDCDGDVDGDQFCDEFSDEFSEDAGDSNPDLDEEEPEEQLEDAAYQSDCSDDEYRSAREKVKECNQRLIDLALQVQRDIEGKGIIVPTNDVPEVDGDGDGCISEYEESDDDVHTPPDSGDEELSFRDRKKKRGVLVGADTDFNTFKWSVGQRFPERKAFKDAVAMYGVLQGRNIYFVVSDRNRQQRLGVKCVKGCPFYVYASWDSRRAILVVRRVIGEHICHRNMKKNRQLKANWVAQQFLEVFKARPHWPAREIMESVRRAFKVLISRNLAYKIKYAAHKMLHGSMHEHYKKVGGYIEALKSTSPGTDIELVTDPTKQTVPPVFQRLFTCFEGLQKGWKLGCRKVICIDACFLKTFLGGQLLVAVGRDGNDQMYPIAWAVAEGENNNSWEWFMIKLQKCLDLDDGEGIAVISDEHVAIINAVASVLPKAEHRHCARHIFAHWHKSFKGDQMKLLFWKIAKAYNLADFNDAVEEMNAINEDAVTAFKSYNPKLFCRAYLDISMKTDAITSNMAETFNGHIINARTKDLIYMLEDIRISLMQRLVVKRQAMQKSTSTVCQRIQVKLDQEKAKAANCDVIPSTDTLFNVNYYLDQLVVDLEAKTCSCRKWNMLGYPCCHAVACIYFLNKEAEDFVEDCYKRETYLKAYAGSIPPIDGERYWPRVEYGLDPPPIKIGPGRPRVNRRKDPMEDPKKPGTLQRTGMEMTCSIYHVKGHNKRRCPNKDTPSAPTEPPPKRSRGRPRKDGQPPISHSQVAQSSTAHHNATAQPTQLGRGGRMCRGGAGSRGGRTTSRGGRTTSGRGSRGGRAPSGRGRGRDQVPIGVGVYFAPDGSAHTNQGGSSRHVNDQASQSSQVSTLHQATQ
ncbi:uncharacterized protein [Spinacia oleracea]|uniref:Uncharacterized protein isoform X2 n=1 Tax=Spinacia oleracea TaxID=3562 RepID=A0ABM3RJ81_SPIOL|nr:uncharacterized protein LOC110791918 isoform X2 [Spinacia oleracea]